MKSYREVIKNLVAQMDYLMRNPTDIDAKVVGLIMEAIQILAESEANATA
jgi:hypothetical protein